MPGNNVGGVSVKVRLDERDALNQLYKLQKEIEKAQGELNKKKTARDSLDAELKKAKTEAEAANKEITKLQENLRVAKTKDEKLSIRAQIADIAKNRFAPARTTEQQLTPQLEAMNAEITKAEEGLTKLTNQAENLKNQVKASTGVMAKLRNATNSATKSMQKGFQRLGRMITKVFWFTTIARGLRAIREYLGDLLLSFPEISQALAEIKGNLLTAAQPIFERIIPAATTLLNILVQVSAVLADIVAKLFHTTAQEAQAGAEALNNQADAYKAAGSAAKKASRQLAAFDELNVLNDDSGSGGASAGGTGAAFNTDFSGNLQGMLEGLELLTGAALLAIGAILTFTGVNIPLGITLMALGAAAVYSALTGDPEALKKSLETWIGDALVLTGFAFLVLGAILAFSGASIPLGIALMVIGAGELTAAAALNWEAIKEKLQGPLGEIMAIVSIAVLVLGAILAFSGAALPLGIALMVIGAAGLATVAAVNWDTIKEKLQGPLGVILAIVSAALLVLGAVLVFTGAALPLGIGLMIAGAAGLAAVAIVNWETIQEALKGPVGKITAIVSAALLVLGAVLTFTGAAIPLGIALMIVGAAGLATVAVVNWNAIKEKLQGPLGEILAIVSAALLVLGIILTVSGANIPLGIALIIAGAAGLVTITALNWDAIKEKIIEVWNGIKSWWDQHVAPIFTAEWWAEKFSSISEGLRQKVTDGINIAIDLFNRFIDWINDRLNISWKGLSLFGTEVISAGSYQLVTLPKIPRLAQGAVIPPNREFMAVLGDQRRGTNIETPLATMVEAFKQAMGEGSGGDLHVSLYMDGSKITDAVIKNYNRRARAGGRYSTI